MKKQYRYFLSIMLVTAIFSYISSAIFYFYFYDRMSSSQYIIYFYIITQMIGVLLPSLVILWIHNHYVEDEKIDTNRYFENANLKTIFYVLIFAFLISIAFIVTRDMLSLVSYVIHPVSILDTEETYQLIDIIAYLVPICILPALFEEFLYRGIVYDLLRRYGIVITTLFGSIVFAMLHGFGVETVFLFVLSIVMYLFRERFNNLVYPMMIHIVYNVMLFISNNTSIFFTNIQQIMELSLISSEMIFVIAIELCISVIVFTLSYLIFKKMIGRINQTSKNQLGKSDYIKLVALLIFIMLLNFNIFG